MTETKNRRLHSPEFKAKVGLQAFGGMKTINQIAQEHDVHPMQVRQWKRDIQDQAKTLFEGKRGPQPVSAASSPDRPYGEIGRLKMELDWLKKSPGSACHDPTCAHADVTQKCQCVLAGVSRTTVYVKRKAVLFVEADEVLKRLIDEEYTRHPFYGSRKMVVYLGRCGNRVNRKRVQRYMRSMSLAGMAPGPNTSAAHPQHKVLAYLLRGVPVVRANQVWSTDIT
jgi:putative transposase